MCLLLIGGDTLGKIDKNLEQMGITDIVHMDGRKSSYRKQMQIPAKTDLIVVLTDYINHNASDLIKKQAKALKIPVIFSKRSWVCLACKIQPFIKGKCC